MDEKFWQFIEKNRDKNPSELRLKYSGKTDDGIDYEQAITQIECRRKYGKKLSQTLGASGDRFIFPGTLAGEQSTSDALAQWHAGLVSVGATVTDMTAGLGIDCLHIARKAREVRAIERDSRLCDALRQNAKTLDINNLSVTCDDSVSLLKAGEIVGDIVFIDPARRSATGGRVFAIQDCEPDLTSLLPDMRKCFSTLIAKLSPMLDITEVTRSLPGITDIYAVGTGQECKEVVAVVNLKETDTAAVNIHAVSVSTDGVAMDFSFTAAEEAGCKTPFAVPAAGDYLYEPLPAVMKSGGFNVLGDRFGLGKLSGNTHIYISKELKSEVPADIFRIEEVIPWQSKNLKRLSKKYPVGEVAVRNLGMSAEALRKKIGVRNGSGVRILGVTGADGERNLLVLRR